MHNTGLDIIENQNAHHPPCYFLEFWSMIPCGYLFGTHLGITIKSFLKEV
jgi:hypothetical protein